MVDSDEIKGIVQQVFYDIKAEVVIADLVENGLGIDDIVTTQKGIFKRRYTRDIDSLSDLKLKNGQELVEILLNRDGLYDSLPEGLFHERRHKSSGEKEESSKESKRIKQEEKAARNFFLPFENEIIRQGIMLELEERKVLGEFSEKLFSDIYPDIWELHHNLNRKYIYRLALLLHFAHKIAGRNKLMAKCLETIIEEKVDIRIVSNDGLNHAERLNVFSDNKKCELGAGELGVDFVCGDHGENYGKTMQFIIGPLKKTQITDYLANGPLTNFLQCFYGYFVPVDYDVTLDVLVDPEKQGFELSEEFGGPVLGFESSI